MKKFAQKFARFISCLLLMTTLWSSSVFAAEEPYQQSVKGASLVTGATSLVADPVFGSGIWGTQTTYEVKNFVMFEIDFQNTANKYFHNLTFDATCNVTIKCYSNNGTPNTVTTTYPNIDLKVNYNPATGATYKGIDYFKFNGAHKVEVVVNNISANGIVLGNYPIFSLTNKVIVTRQYTFNDIPSGAAVINYTTDNKKLNLSWVPTLFPGAEQFDLEWTFVDATTTLGTQMTSNPASITDALLAPAFRNNSGRVTVTGSAYQINLNYTEGFLLYRIRGVQQHIPSGLRYEGNWLYKASPISGSLYTAATRGFVPANWHEINLNWQYNASFAEDGKKKEVISYFDGSLRSRQTVTLNNSDDVAVVGESVYDALGRQTMNILPAPTNNNLLKYYRLFNLNTSYNPVSYQDIPYANCGIIASPLSDSSGVEKYYSKRNPFLSDPNKPWNQAIPQSEGFPFSVTQYTPDNTGRIRAQGGVGAQFQLGTDHETKYYYGKPSQYELDRLFGADAGDHTHYLKNMVVDPNGQVSVTYQNSEGKTIATALAGVPPQNLEPLANAAPPTGNIHDVMLSPSSFQVNSSNSSLEGTSTFLVSSGGEYHFQYHFTPMQYRDTTSAGPLCYTCVYDLLVKITDECGNVMHVDSVSPINAYDTICGNPLPIADSFNVTFYKVGEYTAYFELRVNDSVRSSYTEHYLQNNVDIKKLNYFLLEQLKEEDLAACYSDCDACKTLPDTVSLFINKIKAYYDREGLPFGAAETQYATDLYDSIKANCDSILQTCIESPCDEILDVLKQDVSPGGQYAEFDNDYQLIDPEINVLSHYTQVTYYDEEGQPAQVEDENGNMVAPSALSLKDFILKFEESWATSLVVYHPEYCYYTWCTMNDESQRYNNMLDLQDDATEAIAAGLFDRNNPLALLDHDPFFQGSGHGVAYYGAMKDDLLQYSGNVLNLTAQSNKDILQTIDFLIYCGNQTPPIDWDNCNKAPNDPCRSSYKEWLLYKEWYLDRKLKYYTAAMHDFLPGCSNCFIPSSNQADPSTFGSCTAPPITDFSIDTIPNSTADGMRRIRIKFRNGDESYNWPLNIQIHMASSGGTLTLDQNIVLTPGFGSQEMLVQSDFDIFQITSVTCAQILTERHGVRNLNKSVAGRVTRQSNKNINPFSGAVLSTIANRVNSSNNVLNPSFGKTSAVSSNAIMPIDWPCPAADDFVMTGLATNTFQICYNGITIPAGHSVTVTVDIWIDCVTSGYMETQTFNFCPGQSTCQTYQLPRGCKVKDFRLTSIKCDIANCSVSGDCPPSSDFSVDYSNASGGYEIKVCYNGSTPIPPGKVYIVYVNLGTVCGTNVIITVPFCNDGNNCHSKIVTYAEVCDRLDNASIDHVECIDGSCDWVCPDKKEYFEVTSTYNASTNSWDVTTCYTGPALVPGQLLHAIYYMETACGPRYDTVQFCYNTPACVTQTYSARELCGELGNVSFYSNYCTYGTCGWTCPTDKADFTMNVTQDPITKVWTAHVCYTGGTIPAGHSIQVIYWMKTACRDLLVDTVQICSSSNGCVDVTYQDDEVCKKVYEYGITSFNCINADCQWDCPTDLKLYTASFTQNENGSDWDVTICYNGPTIPANTLVTVYFDLETRCGVLRDSVQFCASSGNCITKTFLKDQVCGVVGSVRIRTVVCSSGNCDWKCPTDLGLYTFNYVHNPTTGDWDLTICYNGPAIPPGKTVTVHYWLKTACGGIEDSLKFCSSSPVCVTKTYSNRSVCGDIGDGGLISVDCSDADCNWECPTKLSLYNITYQQTGNYWEVKVCYTGPAIPVGTAVTAYFQLQTRCGNVITDSVKFCSTSGNCIILQYGQREVCELIVAAAVTNVICRNEGCGWICPTAHSNYSVSLQNAPIAGYKILKVCYNGPAIPAGKTVFVTVAVQTNCGVKYHDFVFCATSPGCISKVIEMSEECNQVDSLYIDRVYCEDRDCDWQCPTDPSNYIVSTTQLPNGDWDVNVCYNGQPIPVGKTVYVDVYVKTACGETKILHLSFCSNSPVCVTRRFKKADVCERIDAAGILEVRCVDGECDWQCPTDESYYNITKTYNPVTTQWEVKICYTGPAIPANKSVLIPVMLLNSGCGQNPINYNLRFCQGITCNNYIVPAAFACNGSFDVKLGEITCVDEPCSADCPDTTQFSAALYNAVSCPGLPNLSVANIRVTHAGGPVNVMAPMERVKVTVKITTFRMAGIIPIVVTDEKTVWFHNGDATKDLCFYYPSNRIITNIQVVKTECAGPCPTGDCCDDPRYGLYDGKVRRFQDYVEPDFDAVLTAYNNGTANFAAYPLTTCKNECEIMADTWIQDLSQCTSDPVRLERIRRALIDVCKQSCQAQQGNNSITPFADANPTPSFESVIAAEFGGVVPNCAYDLISDPYPFGKTPELENDFAVDATPDICNRLSQLRNEAVSHGYTNDPDGVHDYLTAFYKQYYILEKAELEDLFSGCDQCNGIMNLPVELPPFMNGDAKPCLSCDEFAQLEQAFYAKYPTATPSDVKFEVLFRNFANHQTGFSHAYANYFDFKEKCDSNWNNFRDTGRLCELPLQLEMDVDLVAQCMEEKFYNALSNATTIYTAYIDSIRRAFRNNYTSKCLEAQPWLEYDAKLYEYHYTLYYYDQSSNLVKTVPPEGVQFLTDAQITALQANRNSFIAPIHRLATRYQYSTFNQVVWQTTPDAGISEFWYDRLGRLAVSQNAEQKTPVNGGAANRYSYTKYDATLGRITEVGEKSGAASITSIDTRNDAQLQSWLASGTDVQITQTIYDRFDGAVVTNTNITNNQPISTSRKRVVASIFKKIRYTLASQYDAATHYAYDVNGNAKVIWQESAQLKAADPSTQGLKQIDYDYDLISGKVNQVIYQKNKGDQFIYKYGYDADNRVTSSLSSRDGLLWQKDAKYNYYLHGPLARTELGSYSVQGTDYAYTLQGWMKHINAPVMNQTADIGRDGDETLAGNIFKYVSRDALGYMLSYFSGDYKPIQPGSPLAFTETIPSSAGTGLDLFNGNIRATHTQIGQLGTPKTYSYRYDQLNRLLRMRKHETTYQPIVGSNPPALNIAAETAEYQEDVAYDANGNILSYTRNGNSGQLNMDALTYQYERDASGNMTSNKLRYVHDRVPDANYTEDIDNQTSLTYTQVLTDYSASQAGDNYAYDRIGNLIKDTKEKIANIEWTVYGKIKKITKNDPLSTIVEYEYNPKGNRIFQKISTTSNVKYTFYVRDPEGNLISIYTRDGNINPVKWSQQLLTGSGRLGLYEVNQTLPLSSPIPLSGNTQRDSVYIGKTFYELSNHLSNVLVTISDKKIGVENAGTGNVNYFIPEINTANDLYPFGMNMPAREFIQQADYRFGINGQERSLELNKNLSSALYWEYDSRIGKRWNMDPVLKVGESPYACFSNNPILREDPNGDTDSTSRKAKVVIVPIPESEFPTIYKNLLKSFAKGKPTIITYDANRENARRRRREALKNTPTMPGYDRDEYPFASTKEGGAGADVNYVPSSENRKHGGLIGALVVANGMQTGDKFQIVLIPNPPEPEKQPKTVPSPVPVRVRQPEPAPSTPQPILNPQTVNTGVKVATAVGAGYITYKIVVAILTWECFGCGVLVTP